MFDTLADFEKALHTLPTPNETCRKQALARQSTLTKPQGALGRLEALAVWMAGWQETDRPQVETIHGILFAGNHGVCARNVSPFPSSVTAQMVSNFEQGGAAINALSDVFGHDLDVQPLKLDQPTADMSEQPALSEDELLECLVEGAERVENSDADLLYFGEMGIGNTTIAACLAAASFGGGGREWAGRGTGVSDHALAHKTMIIDQALLRHEACFDCGPCAVLAALGGREQAAIAGGVVAARLRRMPVVLDGFVVCGAIAPLVKANRAILSHMVAGHLSHEQGHMKLLDAFRLDPILNLDMCLGEGSGAALACEIIKGAVATHSKMASFEEAGVSKRDT